MDQIARYQSTLKRTLSCLRQLTRRRLRQRRQIAATGHSELVRLETRKAASEQKKSLWERVSSNQILIIILGFILTGIVGNALTNSYSESRAEADRQYQQREKSIQWQRDQRQHLAELDRDERQRQMARKRAFAEELAKVRILRIAEVWEKLYINEAALSETFRALVKVDNEIVTRFADAGVTTSDIQQRGLEAILQDDPDLLSRWKAARALAENATVRSKEAIDSANRNYFWLGDAQYRQVFAYLQVSSRLAAAVASNPKRARALQQQRDNSRVQLAAMRDQVWNE
jgi:restriction endonuclease